MRFSFVSFWITLVLILTAGGRAWALDANQASARELVGVRGIGPKIAARIVQERARGGPFRSLNDLADRVNGLGPRKIRQLEAAGLAIDGRVVAPLSGSPQARIAPVPATAGRPRLGTEAAPVPSRPRRIIRAPTVRSGSL